MKSTTITNGLFAAVGLAFALPLIVAATVGEDNPELKDMSKLVFWGGVLPALALAGKVREDSPSLKTQRILERGIENGEFAVARQQNIDMVQRKMDKAAIQNELITFNAQARSGIMLGPTLNQELAQFAMVQAPQQLAAVGTTGAATNAGTVVSGIDMNLMNGTPAEEFTDAQIDEFYRLVLDASIRPSQALMLAGGTGDGKSSCFQKMMQQKLKHDPDTIFCIVDKKNGSAPEDPKWRPAWGGAPVYPDIDVLMKSSVPFSSVYGASVPKLDKYFEWIWSYIMKYRRPSEKAVDGVFADHDPKADPLWCKETGRARPIYIIIDDATNVMSDLSNEDRDAYARASMLLKKIATEGRTDGVHIIWITHSVTISDNLIPPPMISAMEIVVGSALCTTSALQYAKQSIPAEAAAKAHADKQRGSKRGFGTSIGQVPYLPPANIGAGGIAELINDEWALQSMIHSPAPRRYYDFHHAVLERMGYKIVGDNIVKKDGSTSELKAIKKSKTKAKVTAAPTEDSISEAELVIMLHGMFNGRETTDTAILAAIKMSGYTEDLTAHIENLRSLINLPKDQLLASIAQSTPNA
jgi:hypothetical protein